MVRGVCAIGAQRTGAGKMINRMMFVGAVIAILGVIAVTIATGSILMLGVPVMSRKAVS
jgi:hypothetical protein